MIKPTVTDRDMEKAHGILLFVKEQYFYYIAERKGEYWEIKQFKMSFLKQHSCTVVKDEVKTGLASRTSAWETQAYFNHLMNMYDGTEYRTHIKNANDTNIKNIAYMDGRRQILKN